MKHEQGACGIMGDTTAIVTSHRDTDGASLTITRNDSPMIELDTALEKHLHFQEDVQEGAKNDVPASESTQICLQKVETCLVLKIHQGGDCTKTHGSLTKSATFPSSGKALSSALDGSSKALDMAPHGQSAWKYESPSYTRSTSMPVSSSYTSLVLYLLNRARFSNKVSLRWTLLGSHEALPAFPTMAKSRARNPPRQQATFRVYLCGGRISL